MCVLVRVSACATEPWDAEHLIITVPAGLSPARTGAAIRAVLRKLGAPQRGGGAVCWCGDSVRVSRGSVPAQRQSEEVKHGA